MNSAQRMNAGFSIVPEVLGTSEVDHLVSELERCSIHRSRAGARHLLSVPMILALAHEPRLIALAAGVLGPEPVPFGATLFDKSAHSNWLVAWHQDTALPLRERRDVKGWGPWSKKEGVVYAHAPADALAGVVALRLHLDDSTLENGPLRVLPGTHALGVLSDDQLHEVAQRIQPVACRVGRGGVLIMRPLLVHASSKVGGDAPRRVLHFTYAASQVFGHGLYLRAA